MLNQRAREPALAVTAREAVQAIVVLVRDATDDLAAYKLPTPLSKWLMELLAPFRVSASSSDYSTGENS